MARFLKACGPGLGNGHSNGATDPVPEKVRLIINDIRVHGDAAVRRYSEMFDQWSPVGFRLSPDEIASIVADVPTQTMEDIKVAQSNIRLFAEAQRKSITDFEIETQPGVHLGQKNIPIESVGA